MKQNEKTPPFYPLDPSEKGYTLTPALVRAIVAEEVHKALHPPLEGKAAGTRPSAHVMLVADDGTVWRGMIYASGEREA
jgi:hypothetical protein